MQITWCYSIKNATKPKKYCSFGFYFYIRDRVKEVMCRVAQNKNRALLSVYTIQMQSLKKTWNAFHQNVPKIRNTKNSDAILFTVEIFCEYQ